MKSYKIRRASYNNRKKMLAVDTAQGFLELPYAKLMLKPNAENLVVEVFVDKELGSHAVTYRLADGSEDSVPVDAFLEYNRDPDYLREVELYKLTVKALELMEASDLSKRAVCRRMGTSLSQLCRLLDATNQQKSIDQMIRLVTVLGATVDIKVA